MVNAPPVTAPNACESVIVDPYGIKFVGIAAFDPTSPPAMLKRQVSEQAVPSPTVTATFALEFEMTPRKPVLLSKNTPFWPINPPAITPVSPSAAVTVLTPWFSESTWTLVTVPPLEPASAPTNWPGPL